MVFYPAPVVYRTTREQRHARCTVVVHVNVGYMFQCNFASGFPVALLVRHQALLSMTLRDLLFLQHFMRLRCWRAAGTASNSATRTQSSLDIDIESALKRW